MTLYTNGAMIDHVGTQSIKVLNSEVNKIKAEIVALKCGNSSTGGYSGHAENQTPENTSVIFSCSVDGSYKSAAVAFTVDVLTTITKITSSTITIDGTAFTLEQNSITSYDSYQSVILDIKYNNSVVGSFTFTNTNGTFSNIAYTINPPQ